MQTFQQEDIHLCMHAGCGAYVQGTGALRRAGELLRLRGVCRPLLIAGKTAFSKAGEALTEGLAADGFSCEISLYTGNCVIQDAQALGQQALDENRDCVIGMGGGKVLDLSKAAGAFAGLPVFTVPTIAATCAATTPLSAMYDRDGKYVKNLYHSSSVAGVVADLDVLAAAPPRYLAAGIADSFAKACEYSAFQKEMVYETSDFGRFMGYRLALDSDELLLKIGREAYAANSEGRVTRAFCDAVSCVIPIIGVVSGMGAYAVSGGARFAVAHAYNELIRGRYVENVNRWLHGELVGVGVLCQLAINGMPAGEVEKRREFMRSLGLPCSLRDLGVEVSPAFVTRFVGELMNMKNMEPSRQDRVRAAVEAVG